MKEAYLLLGVKRFSTKSRQRLRAEKVYPIDVALMDGRLDAFAGENVGWRLETTVFIELLRRNRPIGRDVYYYKSAGGYEADFVVCRNNVAEEIYQVSYDISKEIVPIENINMKKDNDYAYIDADKLQGELFLRTPQDGDNFAPFGMKGKRKLLSDFLTDQKLNLFEKERQPLLMDGEEIVWVVGLRSSELYRVDDNTQRVIILSLKS